jgi:hypothetical protein
MTHWRKTLERKLLQLGSTGVLLLLTVSIALAQTTCPALVETALNTVSETCASMGRNQVCYGNTAIDAEFETAEVSFEHPGDRADVVGLQRLATAPLQPETNTWGVAVMAVQANLPDNLPGENATFILFGDTEIAPADAPEGYEAPMQAFSLTTRIGGITCDEVPESGLLVQAPQNTTVNFIINDAEITVGSSALLQVEGDEMSIDTIEGFVEVTSAGATEVVGEGLSTRIRRGQRPQRAAMIRAARVLNAPWRLLPRPVRAAPLVPEGQRVNLNDCLRINRARAMQNAVQVRAGEPIALRFSIPHQSLELARIIQQRTNAQLNINGIATPPYTRIGPWRGENSEYGDHFGIELYWLVDTQAGGNIFITYEMETRSGQPINTGIDGPDADSEPEVIPARQRLFCLLEVV